MSRVHLVLGPDRHGVTEHSARLADALGAPVVRVPDPRDLGPALDRWEPGRPVHLGFTDRIWGDSPEDAARSVASACAGRDATVTLHDIPQPSDGERSLRRRTDCYRAVLAATRLAVVSSRHERDLLREAGIEADPAVVALPVPDLSAAAGHERPLPGLDRSVVVFGFVYPGKGHAEVVAALAAGTDTPRSLVALGECSEGHDDMAAELSGWGARHGVEVTVSGHVPAGRLRADLAAAAVPAAPHRHVSASGSIASWVAAGRRPLVADNRYARELDERWPGAVTLVPEGGWTVALSSAWAEPDSTRTQTPSPWGWAEVATAYRAVLDGEGR